MKKARIEYYWIWRTLAEGITPLVNWRLIAPNGEIVCQSTQGHRDKTDARRAVDTVVSILAGCLNVDELVSFGHLREVGPGRKPKAGG